jgi:hypothetical protein
MLFAKAPKTACGDFGTAKLKRGRVVVKLDADFAKVIKGGDYRVFVTPEGDCRGLYVHRKSASTFEVHELTGGKVEHRVFLSHRRSAQGRQGVPALRQG